MAEIPIERKSGSRSWIWIVALLAIALLAWMLLSDDDDDATRQQQTTGEVGAAPAALMAPSPGTAIGLPSVRAA